MTDALAQAAGKETSTLPGQGAVVLILAGVLALPVSVLLLKLYARRVLHSMRSTVHAGTATPSAPEAPVTPAQHPAGAALRLSVLDNDHTPAAGPADRLLSRLFVAPWRVAAVYAVAGFCFAAVATIAFLGGEVEVLPLRFLILQWTFAWPVVLAANIVAGSTWRARVAVTTVYFLGLAALGGVAAARNPQFNFGQLATLWGLTNVPPSVLLVTFLMRRIRAVGPLVLTFMVVALTGSNVVLSGVAGDPNLLRASSDFGSAIGLHAGGVFIGLIVIGFASFGIIGWMTLKWIGSRYERKRLSDQSITLDAVWLLFGMVNALDVVYRGAVWLLSGVLAFAVYKIVAAAGFLILRKSAAPVAGPKLLLLRAFSSDRRGQRFFDALGMHWRQVASIDLIAGPDLATSTVEPHEFLDFLRGRLARRFIDGPLALDQRVSERDDKPDPDGRFRVNEFFCYEDTWKTCLERLVRTTDATLMDLRGLSPLHAGLVFEIHELINTVPLDRVLFMVDGTTDETFLRQVVQQAWGGISAKSPNRALPSPELRVFPYTGSQRGELRRLLRAVCPAVVPTSLETVRSAAR